MSSTTVITTETIDTETFVTITVTPDQVNLASQQSKETFLASSIANLFTGVTNSASDTGTIILVRKTYIQLFAGEPLAYQEDLISSFTIYNKLLDIWKTWVAIP